MLVAAAHALSKMVPEPTAEQIMPSPFAPGLADVIAEAVQRVK
jgi:malate dehydrogenase (oxaloacetate-decarboxylating)